MITANDDHGNDAGVSFNFYGAISGWHAVVSTHFVILYWEPYGEYEEEELEYQIYVDGEVFQTISSNTQLITELEPSTTYLLTVIAYYNDAIIAFGDYEATTLEPIDDNELDINSYRVVNHLIIFNDFSFSLVDKLATSKTTFISCPIKLFKYS